MKLVHYWMGARGVAFADPLINTTGIASAPAIVAYT